MTHASSRLVHQFFVSLNKFDTSISKVIDKTFSVVNFDREDSLLPTYIGIDVAYEPDHDLLKTTRQFFRKLRSVHQRHFVRFVTDTLWAMESDNGDIFYCHDEHKHDRVDVIWSIKVRDKDQFEVSVLLPPDNRRREMLTDLQYNLDKLFIAEPEYSTESQLQEIVSHLYTRTKNIRLMEFLAEDCHIVLVPEFDGRTFRPVVICGLSNEDAIRRYRSVKNQITHQKYNYSQYFIYPQGIGDYLYIPLEAICENGLEIDKGFCPRTNYDAIEQAFSIYDGASTFDRSDKDVIIFHINFDADDKMRIDSLRYSLDYLNQVH